MAGLVGARECSGHDAAKFCNVAHVDAPHSWIKRESPAHESVSLFLRSLNADKVLIVEGRGNKSMIRKPSFFDYPINLGLAGKMGNVKVASADRFHIRQRGPDKVFDTGILGGAHRNGCLLDLAGTFCPKISD